MVKTSSNWNNVNENRRIRYAKNKEVALIKMREYYLRNAERLKAKAKENYANNKDKKSSYRKKYYRENKNKLLSENKEYRLKNASKIKDQRKQYRSKNYKSIYENIRKWIKANPDKAVLYDKAKVEKCTPGYLKRLLRCNGWPEWMLGNETLLTYKLYEVKNKRLIKNNNYEKI